MKSKQECLDLFDKYTAAMREFIDNSDAKEIRFAMDDDDRVIPSPDNETGFVGYELGNGYRTFTIDVYVEGSE